jgi:hypothetical protein
MYKPVVTSSALQRGAREAYSTASQPFQNAGQRLAQGAAAESTGAASQLGAAAVAAQRGTSAAPLYIMQVGHTSIDCMPIYPYANSVTYNNLRTQVELHTDM